MTSKALQGTFEYLEAGPFKLPECLFLSITVIDPYFQSYFTPLYSLLNVFSHEDPLVKEHYVAENCSTNPNCQAKVKSRKSQKSKKKVKRERERLDFAYCMVISPPPTTHPTLNFSNTSRGPRRQWNTFLRSSQLL